MAILAQSGMSWGQWALGSFLVFVCFLLMLVILLQKGRGGGFTGAFGGAGGASAFGAKTGDVFTWITVVVAGVFVVLTIWGNFVFDESAIAKAPAEAVAEPTKFTVPLEGLEGQPGLPGTMELGITDPKTGEKSTIIVPTSPVPPDGASKPAEGGDAAAPKPTSGEPLPQPAEGEPTAPSKQPPPEGEKKDESENRPNP